MIKLSEKIYTIKEIAMILRLSIPTVRTLINSGKIQAVDVGCQTRKIWRVTQDSLDKYVGKK